MALYTLHPSLSALASNLELLEHLKLAIIESGSDLIPPNASKDSISDGQTPLCLAIETLISPGSDLKPVQKLLSSISEGDSVLYSEHFLTQKACLVVESILAAIPESLPIKTVKVAPKTVSEILELWESVGKEFSKTNRARDLRQRVEAQLLDWTSNFYARIRGKRVLVLSSFSPLVVAGSWILDLTRRIGALAPELDAESDQTVIDWNFVRSFDPHTILIAPLGYTLEQSKKVFFELEKLSGTEKEAYQSTTAAKRGEVYFAGGAGNFYAMDYKIIKTLGVIVSASAGFESGYITERDTFYKLRYLELQRHKI